MTHSERVGGAQGELGQQDRRDKVTCWYHVPIPSTSAKLIRIIEEARFGQLISASHSVTVIAGLNVSW